MKRIRKVAETPVDETKGSIVNTTNIDDKTTNTYSASIIDELIDSGGTGTGIPTDGIIAFNGDTIPEGFEEEGLTEIIPLATTTNEGLMSSNDKAVLNALNTLITKQITVNIATANTWYDTGITGDSLQGGTYILRMYCDWQGQAGQWQESYSGIMSWYHGGTNNTEADEITLHACGHAPNGNRVKLRTLRASSNGYVKLQITATKAMTEAKSTKIYFKKII